MGVKNSVISAITDKDFRAWFECYFGHDVERWPMNSPVLEAVADAWGTSREKLAVTLPPIMAATSGRGGEPATILDWDDRMTTENYEPVMLPKDVARALRKVGIRTIGEPNVQ